MSLQIRKATKSQAKARIGIAAPSGAGKTWDALTIATVLAEGGPIVGIDTERGSMELYADVFDFGVIPLEKPYSPDRFHEALRIAEEAGAAVVVIDSGSHFWNGPGGILEIVDAAKSRFGGNSHAAWQVGTPLQQRMVDAMLAFPGHVIYTMRTKTEWLISEGSNGRKTPTKVGLAPQQRDGLEYEFSITLDVDMDHRVGVGKTRMPSLAGRYFAPEDVSVLAQEILAWLQSGAPERKTALTPREQAEIADRVRALPDEAKDALRTAWTGLSLPAPGSLRPEDMEAALGLLAQVEGRSDAWEEPSTPGEPSPAIQDALEAGTADSPTWAPDGPQEDPQAESPAA